MNTPTAPSGPTEPTDAMLNAPRMFLALYNGGTYPTWDQLRRHCERAGDDVSWWPHWAQRGQTTKSGVAWMIYMMMERARCAPSPQ